MERARAAAARYWPGVTERAMRPDYAGVRPKLALDGAIQPDFAFETESGDDRDWAVLHCLGIESPGLTCALAIAERIADGRGFGSV